MEKLCLSVFVERVHHICQKFASIIHAGDKGFHCRELFCVTRPNIFHALIKPSFGLC